MEKQHHTNTPASRIPWNKGKLAGQKPPLKQHDIWAIRIRLQRAGRIRDLAMFNLAIDSKLRACDLISLRVFDISHGGQIVSRASIIQKMTGHPVRFELTESTRDAVKAWIVRGKLSGDSYLFPSRCKPDNALTTRQYARIVKSWVSLIGLDPGEYGTHSLRRTKPTLIYRRTKNIRAIQLLLGHTKLESTVRYLGVEVDDALELAEKTEG